MNAVTVIKSAKDDPDIWIWEIRLDDGSIYADGEAASEEEAKRKAAKVYCEWQEKQ